MSYQRHYDRKLRLGFVGVGAHAYRNLLPTMTYLPVELVAFCDLDNASTLKAARQYGVMSVYTDSKTMYDAEELDAVILSVSPKMHPQLCLEALEYGLHV
jgi:predicted dehydrogenase